MSFNNIKTKIESERGFTIVELLIVIVVIGILAAITIVAYNGVTARANTTAAAATGATIAKKAEAYNAEKSNYPAQASLLAATADSGTSYYIPLSSSDFLAAALTTSAPATKKTAHFNYYVCGNGGTTAAATLSSMTGSSGTITGIRIDTWNFTSNAVQTVTIGTISGSGGPSSTFPNSCVLQTTF